MRDFSYHRAGSQDDARQAAAATGAMLLAGGTTLLDLAKCGVAAPRRVSIHNSAQKADSRASRRVFFSLDLAAVLSAAFFLEITDALVPLGVVGVALPGRGLPSLGIRSAAGALRLGRTQDRPSFRVAAVSGRFAL